MRTDLTQSFDQEIEECPYRGRHVPAGRIDCMDQRACSRIFGQQRHEPLRLEIVRDDQKRQEAQPLAGDSCRAQRLYAVAARIACGFDGMLAVGSGEPPSAVYSVVSGLRMRASATQVSRRKVPDGFDRRARTKLSASARSESIKVQRSK